MCGGGSGGPAGGVVSDIDDCNPPGWFYVLWTTPLVFTPFKGVVTQDCRPVSDGIARRRYYGRCYAGDNASAIQVVAEPTQLGSATPAGVQVMGIGL